MDDLRLKMCIEITGEDFFTIHHELGHNFYQRAYDRQPFLFRDSANDGFHEAIGDTIALSVTPEYLVKIGLLDNAPDASKDIGLLLRTALEKIAFLPFGLLIDEWRWKVFSGQVTPDHTTRPGGSFSRSIRASRRRRRARNRFRPRRKYHVAANVPYMRYFLADILQFQFHRALAQAAGCTGPLNRCSVYGNKEAGARTERHAGDGRKAVPGRKPWRRSPGSREMDASAIRDYFAPLQKWLDEQNQGKPIGW